MRRPSAPSEPRPRRRVAYAAIAVLAAVTLLLAGCIQIVSIVYDTDVEAGPAHTFNMQIKFLAASSGTRAVVAFRFPEQWDVTAVSYDGDHTGTFTRSQVMVDYYMNTWEAAPVDQGHTGHKVDHIWWVGYGDAHAVAENDVIDVTIVVDTNGWGGDYLLDFIGGLADATAPTDPAQNGDGATWELGSSFDDTTDPPGPLLAAKLDQPISLADREDPTILSTTPAHLATGVDINVAPRITFSEDMDESTLDPAHVFLRTSGAAAPLPAANFYNGATHELIIDPNTHLEYDTQYLIVVDADVADLVGYTLGTDYIGSFTTGSLPVAPTVLSTSPADLADDVPVDTDVTVTFDMAMDPTTLTTATVFLKPASAPAGPALPATVTYDGASHAAVLDPASALLPDTEYEATVAASVEGQNGLALGTAYSWTFTTSPNPLAFTDVPPTHRYHDAIQGMADLGIINGYPLGGGLFEFRPDNPVWRWQFAKMIVGALELAIDETKTSPFTDLDPDNPSQLDQTEYVAVAFENNITKGLTATKFGPYKEISRAQVVTMVVRAVQSRYPGLLVVPPVSYANSWGTGFSADHGQNARLAEYNGLLDGLPLTTTASDPWGAMPRGEVAQVLWNMIGMLP